MKKRSFVFALTVFMILVSLMPSDFLQVLAAEEVQFSLSHEKIKFVTKTQANAGLTVTVTNTGEETIEYRAYMSDKDGNELPVDHFRVAGDFNNGLQTSVELTKGIADDFDVRMINDTAAFIDEYFTVEAWPKGDPTKAVRKTVTVSYDNTITFTRQPVGGSLVNGEDYVFEWASSPMPEKPEDGRLQVYREGYDDWFTLDYINTSPATIAYDNSLKSGTYRFRIEIYGDLGQKYTSDEFEVTWQPCQFTQQPQSGQVLVDEDYKVSWKLNFVPETVNVQILLNGDWDHLTGASATGGTIPGYGEPAVRTFRVVAFNKAETVYSENFTVTYVQKHDIIVYCDPIEGTVTANPTSALKGTEITLTADPTEGHAFKEWVVDWGGVDIKDNKFIMGDDHVRIRGVFIETFENARIISDHLPSGLEGDEYSFQLEATGDKPITWSLPVESLPAGLTLDPATGLISGIPEAFHGSITVRAANKTPWNSTREDETNLTLYIYRKPVFTDAQFAGGREKDEYLSDMILDTGSYVVKVQYTLVAGQLPEGLELQSLDKTARITGTPTKEGTYNFTLQADVLINDDVSWSGTHDYTITIEPQLHAVSVASAGNGSAKASVKEGPKGTQVTLTASPDKDYRLARWEVLSGGVKVKNNKFTIGDNDIEIVAHFEKITYWFAVYNSRSLYGRVSVDGVSWDNSSGEDFEIGSKCTAYASPNEGYHFVRWEDENKKKVSTEKYYTFTLKKDTTLYAIFAEDEIVVQIRYDFTAGNQSSWKKGTDDNLKFTVRRTPGDQSVLSHLQEIKVDGTVLAVNQYMTAGTDILLTKEMLEKLTLGSHKLQLSFDDYLGLEGTFTILETDKPEPRNYSWLWAIPALAVVGGGLFLFLARKKKEEPQEDDVVDEE